MINILIYIGAGLGYLLTIGHFYNYIRKDVFDESYRLNRLEDLSLDNKLNLKALFKHLNLKIIKDGTRIVEIND